MEGSAGSAPGRAAGEPPLARDATQEVALRAVEWSVSPWRERPVAAVGTVLAALGLWLLVVRLLPGERLAAAILGLLVQIGRAHV